MSEQILNNESENIQPEMAYHNHFSWEKTFQPNNILKIEHFKNFDLHNQLDIPQVAYEINEYIRFICKNVVGREEVVRQSFYAFLTGEHQLLLGRTGMAKSLLARQIFECFDQVSVFEKHLTKDTTPDNLFGAYDLVQMKHGKMVHNIDGSLVTADFAFLDEIFDANDMLLRSLLSLLNERKLVNGEQIVNSPLNTVIAASNYIRTTEMLEAVSDRFIYKSYIPENKNLYYQFSVDQVYGQNIGNIRASEKKLALDKLRIIKSKIKTQVIQIPDYILFLKSYIVRQYINETKKTEGKYNFTISDRTATKIQDLLRASAIFNGRTMVQEEDLNNLYFLICMVGIEEEKKRLKGIIETTKRYFSQDKELLTRTFEIIQVFRSIKSSPDPGACVENEDFAIMLKNIEHFIDESNLKNKLKNFFYRTKNFMNKIGVCPNKSKLEHILEILQDSCVLLKGMATKQETVELITGFEQDIDQFSETYIQTFDRYDATTYPEGLCNVT